MVQFFATVYLLSCHLYFFFVFVLFEHLNPAVASDVFAKLAARQTLPNHRQQSSTSPAAGDVSIGEQAALLQSPIGNRGPPKFARLVPSLIKINNDNNNKLRVSI